MCINGNSTSLSISWPVVTKLIKRLSPGQYCANLAFDLVTCCDLSHLKNGPWLYICIVCACVRAFAMVTFQGRVGDVCIYWFLFKLRAFMFWYVRETLFEVIVGLLGMGIRSALWRMQIERQDVYVIIMSKSVYICVCVSWLLIIEIIMCSSVLCCALMCKIERQL